MALKYNYDWVGEDNIKYIKRHVIMKIAYILEVSNFSNSNRIDLVREVMVKQNPENRFLIFDPKLMQVQCNPDVNVWEYFEKGNKYKRDKERV